MLDKKPVSGKKSLYGGKLLFLGTLFRGSMYCISLIMVVLSSAHLISRYILQLGQRGRCCFCDACPNRKMYLEIRRADEGLFRQF